MKRLPDEFANQIDEHLTVEWWGRRAVFEVVEEFSEAIYRVWIILSFAWYIDSLFEFGWPYWVGVAILCLLAANHAIVEYNMWLNEVYVVCSDQANGGGRIFKFQGWLNKRRIPEAITPTMPAVDARRSAFYRLWGHLTGEQMENVNIESANNIFISGRRVSPRLSKTIESMRGSKPRGEQGSGTELSVISDIRTAMVADLISKKEAQQATRQLLKNTILGG